MQVFYRILAVVSEEASVEVRYWSDEISEGELRTDPENDKAIPPIRCRTDTNFNVKPDITPAELHDLIMNSAPVEWLTMKGNVKNPAIDTSLSQLTALVGQDRSEDLTQEVPVARNGVPPERDVKLVQEIPRWRRRMPNPWDQEIDISECLDGVTQPAEPPVSVVHLYRITTKTNGGPWGYPTKFDGEDLAGTLMPFLKRLYTDVPGILSPSTVYFESSNVFVRKWTVDTIATALALIRFMADDSVPESKAMRDVARTYHDKLPTTYSHVMKLTKEPG